MKIQVTEDDLRNPYLTTLSNPISRAILRITGQWWYVFDGTSVRQMSAPLHYVRLPREVSHWWQEYRQHKDQDLHAVPPIEFEIDLK